MRNLTKLFLAFLTIVLYMTADAQRIIHIPKEQVKRTKPITLKDTAYYKIIIQNKDTLYFVQISNRELRKVIKQFTANSRRGKIYLKLSSYQRKSFC